jgi:hypothetical protein
MNHFIFFSKSYWRETPRLRHQVANLIREFHGHVLFFQKPAFPWGTIEASRGGKKIDETLDIVEGTQLIHHQLRILPALSWLNNYVEKKSIRRHLGNAISADAIIINFNYDYYFLRQIFPDNRIITIINDDFVAQAKFFSGRHVERSLKKTCEMSDVVLAVSYPLMRQVEEWCTPHLFFPWADVEYLMPDFGGNRTSVLLWAHIDSRVDLELLSHCVRCRPEVIFYIVGPHARALESRISAICEAANVRVILAAKLDELPLNDFFAAIIPYKSGISDIEAVTMSNKSLQLMARGLPLVTHGMPAFYENPAIFKAETYGDFLRSLDYCREYFFELQDSIRTLVSENQRKDRFEFLMNIIARVEA